MAMTESWTEAVESRSIAPYRFESTKVSNNSNIDESESNLDEDQANFTDKLDHTSWCFCTKCSSMPRAVGCFCCYEIEIVSEQLEGSELASITEVERFKVVCLANNALID